MPGVNAGLLLRLRLFKVMGALVPRSKYRSLMRFSAMMARFTTDTVLGWESFRKQSIMSGTVNSESRGD